MTERSRNLESQRGAALLMVVMYLAVLGLLATTFFSVLNRRMDTVRAEEQRQVCLNLAEAGVNKAIAVLRAGNRDYTGESDAALGDGEFSVSVTRADTGVFHIAATAALTTGALQRRPVAVTADVQLNAGGEIRQLYWRGASP